MKKIFLTAMILAFTPLAMAETVTTTGREDGVGSGGSGGNPNANVVGTMSLMGPTTTSEVDTATVTTSSLRRPTVVTTKTKETVVTVNREELLKAVDAALNSTDIEMEVDQEPVTVRLQKFDLNRGILHGQILETKNTIRLIDEAKAKK